MALNSINTNVAAYYAQSNIGKASTMASSSIARLSSGDRIVRAADDVAAMSAGTSLRTNVTTLKMALINTTQGASLLQVADGALSQITDILQRQKAISVQAGSGSLSDAERSFLNQEFQNLSEEIDRLAGQTNFNGVNLLDGSLSERVDVTDNKTAAVQGGGSIGFTVNATGALDEININGVVFTATTAATTATQFRIGATLDETLDNLVTTLNASTNQSVSMATYSRDGTNLVFKADGGGTQSNNFRIRLDNSTWLNTGANSIQSSPNLYGNTARALLYTAGTITASSIDSVVTSAGGAALNTPFKIGEQLKVDVDNAGTAFAATVINAAFTATDTLRTVVNSINSNTVTHGITARIVGNSGNYNIELEFSKQSVDGQYDAANNSNADLVATVTTVTAGLTLNAGGSTTAARIFSLSGGTDTGIGAGDTVGVGSIGNSIITSQNQTKSSVEVIFPDIAPGNLSTNLIATGGANAYGLTVAGVTFQLSTNASTAASNTEVTLGSTLAETLDNFVAKINGYSGTEAQMYMFNQVRARREGNSIIIESKDVGTTGSLTAANTAVDVADVGTFAGSVSVTAANVNNGSSTGGINTSGVRNADFLGTLQGFSATYNGTINTVNMSVTVGDHTYNATNVTSNPTANTVVRFTSETGGGYFDIQMSANNGNTVSSQTDADLVATRFNAAFESMSFYQNRTVSSYSGNSPIVTGSTVTGSLIGTNVEMQLSSFDDVSIDSIRVNAPQGSSTNGTIVMTVNGVEFSASASIGSKLGAYQTYKLTSAENANEYILFSTGAEAIQFDTADKAAAFQSALETAFGVGDGSAELAFQVGVTTSDTLSVGINNVTTNKLFGGESIDVLTKVNAAHASDVIDEALDIVTAVRAEVGALQSRFDFAAANVESSIQNQDAARGVLLDTDVASESTAYATAQVQLQAGIAVLAQANLLPQNLLKLIG